MRRFFVLYAFLAGIMVPAEAWGQQELSADYLDMDGVALADTPETDPIPMAAHGQMTQLTLRVTITWGTSTQLIAKCKTSASEDSGYAWVDTCQWDGTYYQCKPLPWRWNSTDSTTADLEMRTNARYVICVFDDPDDGTGTAVVTGTRGQP